MAGQVVRARLRKGKDDDIAQALSEALVTKDEADILREALRLYFGLSGQRNRVPAAVVSSPGVIEKPKLQRTKKEDLKINADDALDGLLGF